MKKHEIIFGSNKERAIHKLNEIINDIIASDDEFIIKERKDCVETNKRRISAIFAGQSARGYRCTKAYVDYDVRIGTLYTIIHPCLLPNGYIDGKFNIEMFGEL